MKIISFFLIHCLHCLTNADYSWLMPQAYFHQKMWKVKIMSYLSKYPRTSSTNFPGLWNQNHSMNLFPTLWLNTFFFPKRNLILKWGHSNWPRNILDCQISQLFLISVIVWKKPQSWQLQVVQRLVYKFLFLRWGYKPPIWISFKLNEKKQTH